MIRFKVKVFLSFTVVLKLVKHYKLKQVMLDFDLDIHVQTFPKRGQASSSNYQNQNHFISPSMLHIQGICLGESHMYDV